MKKKSIIMLSIILAIILMFVGAFIMKKDKNNETKPDDGHYDYLTGEFNLNLIKTVNAGKSSNYLISPYSIEIALNMLKDGANNNTYDEILKVVGSRDISDVIIKDHIGVANAAFIKNKYEKNVKEEYYNTLDSKYHSEILYDEFTTPKVINDWVNKKTNGMIDKILDKTDKDFVLGLANALAIDVEWNSQFDCAMTQSNKFTKENGKTVNVEMMHQAFTNEGVKYLKNSKATGVIIPYKKYDKTGEEVFENGDNLEFVAILPNDSVNDYINNLSNKELNKLMNSAKEAGNDVEINVALPRFKYDYELDDFKEVLMKLGIKDAFDPDLADFTNMIKRDEELTNIYVGEAIHKTHIDLNEKGTKAAAVTYFGMYKSTAVIIEKEHINITFDKPFIYMIRDAKTNETLFFGVVYEPNNWQGSTCTAEK